MKTVRIYKDLDLSFTPHPGTGDVGMKFDINSVKQSLRILLLTANGERPCTRLDCRVACRSHRAAHSVGDRHAPVRRRWRLSLAVGASPRRALLAGWAAACDDQN